MNRFPILSPLGTRLPEGSRGATVLLRALDLASHELHKAHRILFRLRGRRAAILQAILVSGEKNRPLRVWNSLHRPAMFACSTMGKIRGTLCMRSHISIHVATTKYFSNSFVFKNKIEKEGLPRDGPPGLGAGGPRFKSGRPDQNHLPYFLQLIKNVLHPKLHCGIPADRRPGFASYLVSESSPHDEFCKNMGGRRAIQKPLNGSKLNARHLASMGKIQGTLCISGLINLRKCKSVITPSAQLVLRRAFLVVSVFAG
jgi:hypothetical protein